jgi:glutathione synthase/RimK-type ligase-like ATP-grasp enzyme
MKKLIYPYIKGSASAKALSESIGVKIAAREKNYPLPCDVLINWGASVIHRKVPKIVINNPDAIKTASNKLSTLLKLKEAGVPLPPFCTSIVEASKWLPGHSVMCRTKLTGHSGEGIVIAENEQELVEAPLYTRYIKKKEEYRVHASCDGVFFVQRKARKKDVPDDQVNWKVRNLKGGFIYANQDVDVPQDVKDVCVQAIKAIGLHFGAVDIILGADKKWYVLEVNTACGLAGTTLQKYKEMFVELLKKWE